jgi:hypothetical protein
LHRFFRRRIRDPGLYLFIVANNLLREHALVEQRRRCCDDIDDEVIRRSTRGGTALAQVPRDADPAERCVDLQRPRHATPAAAATGALPHLQRDFQLLIREPCRGLAPSHTAAGAMR